MQRRIAQTKQPATKKPAVGRGFFELNSAQREGQEG